MHVSKNIKCCHQLILLDVFFSIFIRIKRSNIISQTKHRRKGERERKQMIVRFVWKLLHTHAFSMPCAPLTWAWIHISSARFEFNVTTHLLDIKMTSATIPTKLRYNFSCPSELLKVQSCVSKFIAEYLATVSFCLHCQKPHAPAPFQQGPKLWISIYLLCNFEISALQIWYAIINLSDGRFVFAISALRHSALALIDGIVSWTCRNYGIRKWILVTVTAATAS